jgi:Asp-tRNA(Asn)/Glu-tRNA(Gln) amidotransferase A subunit family amidase
MSKDLINTSKQLHDFTVTEAAAAIKDGSLSASTYAAALLRRNRDHKDMNAFITIDEDAVLEAASKADEHRGAGKALGPLHGVPIAVKDSMNTFDLPTSIGTHVLAGFMPKNDASIVASLRNAGAIIFGKNNLVEMSYGLTGLNAHYGQAVNPYDSTRVTGGSSGGAGASVGGRLVPAAFGGDTVGSIRVPASFSGVVGFRPTTGRWAGTGVAPISNTFDTPGPMARSVADVVLLDAVVTGSPLSRAGLSGRSLKGVRLGFAPRQYLDLVDPEVERTFHESLAKLKDAGAELIEIDLGDDFQTLAYQANWPVFFHETMPHVTQYLKEIEAPVSFDDIYKGLGANVDFFWSDAVVPGTPNYVSVTDYEHSLNVLRPSLQKRFADAFRENGIEAILFPTTPLVAPLIGTSSVVTIAGQEVPALNIAKNVFASSCAGLPGISLPMGLSSGGLPIGLEIDGKAGDDVRLLDIAALVSSVLGSIPAPNLK